jgi:hypothetical protein
LAAGVAGDTPSNGITLTASDKLISTKLEQFEPVAPAAAGLLAWHSLPLKLHYTVSMHAKLCMYDSLLPLGCSRIAIHGMNQY